MATFPMTGFGPGGFISQARDPMFDAYMEVDRLGRAFGGGPEEEPQDSYGSPLAAELARQQQYQNEFLNLFRSSLQPPAPSRSTGPASGVRGVLAGGVISGPAKMGYQAQEIARRVQEADQMTALRRMMADPRYKQQQQLAQWQQYAPLFMMSPAQ